MRIPFFFCFFFCQETSKPIPLSRYLVLFILRKSLFSPKFHLCTVEMTDCDFMSLLFEKNEIYVEPTLSPYKAGQWHNGGCCHATVLTKIAL